MFWISCGVILLVLCTVIGGNIPPPPSSKPLVPVNKCCEKYELMLNSRCRHVNETEDGTAWSPIFSDAQGHDNIQVPFKLRIGVPECGPRQHFTIYHLPGSPDRLLLLPNGHLRHYFLQYSQHGGEELWEEDISAEQRFYDYEQGLYCLDKVSQSLVFLFPLKKTFFKK